MISWLKNLVIPPWVAPLICVASVMFAAWNGFNAGVQYEHAKNEATQNAELVKKQKHILELTTMNRELERQHTIDNIALNNLYQEQAKNAQAKVNSIIHDVRTGNKRLYVNTQPPVRTDNGSEASGIAAIRLGDDAATRSELSKEDAEFLISFAAEADQVAEKLKWCQGKLLIDRNLPVPALQLVPLSLINQEE